LRSVNPEKRWISGADAIAFCQLSPTEDAIPPKRMGPERRTRVEKRVSFRGVLQRH
jgi:hypothetical protein